VIKTTLSLLATVVLLGCNSYTTQGTPPQLWSDHKSLDVSAEVCSEKAYAALNSLGFTEAVKKDNFTYANHGRNRAAVKCVSTHDGSFLYFAVAGPDKESVEKLRNEIAWKF
jgi:hypothetical protein